jgi:hypothetical protein
MNIIPENSNRNLMVPFRDEIEQKMKNLEFFFENTHRFITIFDRQLKRISEISQNLLEDLPLDIDENQSLVNDLQKEFSFNNVDLSLQNDELQNSVSEEMFKTFSKSLKEDAPLLTHNSTKKFLNSQTITKSQFSRGEENISSDKTIKEYKEMNQFDLFEQFKQHNKDFMEMMANSALTYSSLQESLKSFFVTLAQTTKFENDKNLNETPIKIKEKIRKLKQKLEESNEENSRLKGLKSLYEAKTFELCDTAKSLKGENFKSKLSAKNTSCNNCQFYIEENSKLTKELGQQLYSLNSELCDKTIQNEKLQQVIRILQINNSCSKRGISESQKTQVSKENSFNFRKQKAGFQALNVLAEIDSNCLLSKISSNKLKHEKKCEDAAKTESKAMLDRNDEVCQFSRSRYDTFGIKNEFIFNESERNLNGSNEFNEIPKTKTLDSKFKNWSEYINVVLDNFQKSNLMNENANVSIESSEKIRSQPSCTVEVSDDFSASSQSSKNDNINNRRIGSQLRSPASNTSSLPPFDFCSEMNPRIFINSSSDAENNQLGQRLENSPPDEKNMDKINNNLNPETRKSSTKAPKTVGELLGLKDSPHVKSSCTFIPASNLTKDK